MANGIFNSGLIFRLQMNRQMFRNNLNKNARIETASADVNYDDFPNGCNDGIA